MDAVTRPWVLLTLLVSAGCIGTSPEEARRDSLGPETGVEPGPLHRPGQPCLACHGEDYSPGDAVFAVAGTVYLRASDPVGLEGAVVTLVDDAGRELSVTTNRAGNFMVQVGGDGEDEDEDGEEREEGRVHAPFDLRFPLRASVAYREHEQVMRSVIHRDGSCGSCHTAEPGAASVGRVWVEEEGAP